MPNISTRLANCNSVIHIVYDAGKSSILSLTAAALVVYTLEQPELACRI